MKTYQITITGEQPLLLHHDDIDWADEMEKWRLIKENKKSSKPGDDRTPAYRWIGCLYRNEKGEVVMPTQNIMRMLMEGGAQILVPGGRNGKTFKEQTQSGILPDDIAWPLLVAGEKKKAVAIPTKPITDLLTEKDFNVHREAVKHLGFNLDVRRAKIGKSKHVRVRPRLEPGWQTSGKLTVIDDQITQEILTDILEVGGKRKGLGDWRPSSPTPGSFGLFEAKVRLAN